MLLCKAIPGFQQSTVEQEDVMNPSLTEGQIHSQSGFTLQAKSSQAEVWPPVRMKFSWLIKMHFFFLFSPLVNKINNRLVEYKELALCIVDSQRCFTALDSKHKSWADDVFISVQICVSLVSLLAWKKRNKFPPQHFKTDRGFKADPH